MRIASKVDTNQPAIVQTFRQLGARVQVLSFVGKGFPDLLICYRGTLALVEVIYSSELRREGHCAKATRTKRR